MRRAADASSGSVCGYLLSSTRRRYNFPSDVVGRPAIPVLLALACPRFTRTRPPARRAPGEHGTFRTAAAHLDYVASMKFDVVYLPPIHPIGTVKVLCGMGIQFMMLLMSFVGTSTICPNPSFH